MNFLETLSTFEQMTLFAAIFMVSAVAATVAAVIVAHRQNKRFDERSRYRCRHCGGRIH